jgi:hypothetical protein
MSELFHGLYKGTIVDINDPDKAKRVKINIPGLCEPHTNWARKRGGSFSFGENFGNFGGGIIGADVLVQFEAGDINNPWYEYADVGAADIPSEVRGSHDKFILAFGDIRFLITLNDVGGSIVGKVKIYSATLSDENYIELDGLNNILKLNALTQLEINATGLVKINGGLVTIQNRVVNPGGAPIK